MPQKIHQGKHMKFKTLIAAVTLAASSFGAFAGSATFAGGVAYFQNDPLAASHGFTQTINFSGLAAGLYDIVGGLSGTNMNFTAVDLDGAGWDLTNVNGKKSKFGLGFLEVTGGKPLTLTLKGTTFGAAGSYNGSISVTAVPEPETFAMLLAGLGLMGAIARRRNKTAA
jgi:hypothetical protein